MFTVKGNVLSRMRVEGRLPGLSHGARKVQESMGVFQTSLLNIDTNADYTQEAKDRMKARVRENIAAARPTVLADLASDWNSIRHDYARLQDRQAQVAEKAASGWDYQRLAYETLRVRQVIETASGNPMTGLTTTGAIRQAYEAAQRSGDRVLLRAWAENGPGLLDARFSGSDSDELLAAAEMSRQMQDAFDRLTATPERAALETEAAALMARVSDLSTVTERAWRFFEEPGRITDSPFTTPGEFDRLAEGISLRASYDPQAGDFINELDVNNS